MERNKLARQIIDTCSEMTRLGLNQGDSGERQCTLSGWDADYAYRHSI